MEADPITGKIAGPFPIVDVGLRKYHLVNKKWTIGDRPGIDAPSTTKIDETYGVHVGIFGGSGRNPRTYTIVKNAFPYR